MRTISVAALGLVLAVGSAAVAQQAQQALDPARVDAAVKAAFPNAPADWQGRLTPDATMKECSAYRNSPPKAVADAIRKRELAAVKYPADGVFVGDWKKGEALAQSGYGLRFSDYPPRRVNGGNCYACHQVTKKEVSYGTIGPSLLEYGKLRDFKPEAIKAVYERIYNPQTAFPCSNMPRFGTNGVLTIEQVKDLVALLMSPESPVNKGQ
jgi:sulfur-oxidizing protein SoxX